MLDRMPARDARMHVILKQQGARWRELLGQISRDQRLEVLTAAQRVRAKVHGPGSPGNRLVNPLARLGDNLVVYLFISNFRDQTVKFLVLHGLSPRFSSVGTRQAPCEAVAESGGQ